MNTAGDTDDHGLDLIPFRGVRYVPERVGSLAAVTSPPYDVVVRPDGLLHLESADPHNIVRLILPQATTPAARNDQAADTLRSWLAQGILAPDPVPSLYVYEQRDGDILQRGVIGALRLSEAADGIVLPHEGVMPHVVEDRAALMRATSANLEPLLLTYRSDGNATGALALIERTVLNKPLLSTTTEDGFSHRLWAVTDPAELAEIQTDLARHQALIADGHHRWATNLRLRSEHPSPGPWDYGLVLLVDTARYPCGSAPSTATCTNSRSRTPWRPWRTASASAPSRVPCRARSKPWPMPPPKATPSSSCGDGRYHLVDRPSPDLLARTIRTDRPEAWRTLDATVLHSTLLDHIWQIPDAPEHIAYIHDTEATVEKAERDGGTAILMHPVREEVVRDLARQGVTMPRKSTSFGPKPASGLVLRSLDV